jgi:hypothetical protein
MSATVALALKDLEKDAEPAANLTVECCACDPDNPRAVPRSKCRSCGGTGRSPIRLGSIVTEIHASRLELLLGNRKKFRKIDDSPEAL